MEKKKVVLLIEQDSGIAGLIEVLMQDEFDVQVVAARDPEEAIERSAHLNPALVLLDVDTYHHYDLETALEVVERAKPLRARHDVPVIGLSAHFSAYELSEARFDDFIGKPFDIDLFIRKVRRQLTEPTHKHG